MNSVYSKVPTKKIYLSKTFAKNRGFSKNIYKTLNGIKKRRKCSDEKFRVLISINDLGLSPDYKEKPNLSKTPYRKRRLATKQPNLSKTFFCNRGFAAKQSDTFFLKKT